MFSSDKIFNFVKGVPVLPEMTADTTDHGRFYTCPDGTVYPSVTTVLSILPKDGLKAWQDRVGPEEAEHVLKQAGVRGEAVHNMAEAYIRGENWRKGQMPANIATFLPIKKVLDDHVDNIVYVEAPLHSHFLRTAGRVDLIADYDNVRSIIDHKTSRGNKTTDMIEHYFMQKSAYAVMFEELTGKPVGQIVTIMSSDDSPTPLVWVKKRDDWIHKFIEVRKEYDAKKGTNYNVANTNV